MKRLSLCIVALALLAVSSGILSVAQSSAWVEEDLLKKGKGLLHERKFEKAESVFSRAIAKNPSDPKGYLGRGLALLGMGETDRAIGEFTRAIDLDPQFDRAYEGRGEAALKQNRYKDAYMDFARAVKLNPSNDSAQKQMDEASRLNEEKFGRKLAFDETWKPGGQGPGQDQQDMGWEKGLREPGAMPPVAPQEPQYRPEMGRNNGPVRQDKGYASQREKGDMPPGGTITIVERSGGASAEASYSEGNAYLKTNQLDKAIAEYEKAVALDPKLAKAYINMGIALGRKGEYEKAAAAYTRALNIDPNYDKAYFNRGVAQEKLGHPEKAAADYRKALELNPEFDSPRKNLARLMRAGSGTQAAATPAQLPKAAAPSDLMSSIPKGLEPNPDAIAVVIGNRAYKKAKEVQFAHNDADAIRAYLIGTLGYKEGNVFLVKDASLAEMTLYFGNQSSHKGKLFNAVKEGKSDVFVYYSGHGAPGLKDHKGYFVPVEADPQYIELGGYPAEVFYANLAKVPARLMTVVLDACFSGASLFENISPMVVEVKAPDAALTNGVVLSSSASSQPSSWYPEMRHGMFTYFLLRGIKDRNADMDADGVLTFDELYTYISDKTEGVPYYARRLHGVEQDPTIQGQYKGRVVVRY